MLRFVAHRITETWPKTTGKKNITICIPFHSKRIRILEFDDWIMSRMWFKGPVVRVIWVLEIYTALSGQVSNIEEKNESRHTRFIRLHESLYDSFGAQMIIAWVAVLVGYPAAFAYRVR